MVKSYIKYVISNILSKLKFVSYNNDVPIIKPSISRNRNKYKHFQDYIPLALDIILWWASSCCNAKYWLVISWVSGHNTISKINIIIWKFNLSWKDK